MNSILSRRHDFKKNSHLKTIQDINIIFFPTFRYHLGEETNTKLSHLVQKMDAQGQENQRKCHVVTERVF